MRVASRWVILTYEQAHEFSDMSFATKREAGDAAIVVEHQLRDILAYGQIRARPALLEIGITLFVVHIRAMSCSMRSSASRRRRARA